MHSYSRGAALDGSSSPQGVKATSALACDVVIAGGGMVGMALAIALAKAGLGVVVAERESLATMRSAQFDGRVSAIAYGSVCLLKNLGVWSALADHAQPITDIRVSDGDSAAHLHYRYDEIGEEPFGFIVENRHTRQALHECASQHTNLRVVESAAVAAVDVQPAHVEIRLNDGMVIKAALLVAADGRQSQVRRMLGIEALSRHYGQTAIVATIAHTQPHDGLAQERFLSAGPFAVLPMMGNRSSLVWVEPDDRASAYLSLAPHELVAEVGERVGSYLGQLSLVDSCFSYPLSLMHAKSYVAPRSVLVGDAAHGIHPIAGQGVNLGFRDIAVLAELLAQQKSLGLDLACAEMLNRYQRWRRFDNTTMMAVTDGLNHLFTRSWLPVRIARSAGLWGVGRLPPLKRVFMRHAMGLMGDVPTLMRPAV